MDTYNEHNPDAPWNKEELPPLSELEQLQEDYGDLISKIKKAKDQLNFCIDIAENGENTLLLNKLKNIKL